MPENDMIRLKFRLYDGSDIGPFQYSPATTVFVVKERIVSEWPQDKKIVPKTPDDIKLINSGKILEDGRRVSEYKDPFNDLFSEIITMHVVVQPSPAKAKPAEKKIEEVPKRNLCSCSIM